MGVDARVGYPADMIFAFVLAAVALWSGGMILMVVHVRRAPEGFEDARGFHQVDRDVVRFPEPRRLSRAA